MEHKVVAVIPPIKYHDAVIQTAQLVCTCGHIEYAVDNDTMMEHIKRENENRGLY